MRKLHNLPVIVVRGTKCILELIWYLIMAPDSRVFNDKQTDRLVLRLFLFFQF